MEMESINIPIMRYTKRKRMNITLGDKVEFATPSVIKAVIPLRVIILAKIAAPMMIRKIMTVVCADSNRAPLSFSQLNLPMTNNMIKAAKAPKDAASVGVKTPR